MPTFAAIDIGSNSVRLFIAKADRGRIRAIHQDREVTRLGEGAFQSGFLSPESMADTIRVLRRFQKSATDAGADAVRIVATSAMRDAKNSAAFMEWVRSTTGWTVEIISGIEEGRLIHLGLTSSTRLTAAPVLMIDLGGGSCELTISTGGRIKETVSLPLGAVRLTHEFLHHDPPQPQEIEKLRKFVTREVDRIAQGIVRAKIAAVIATSGTAAALFNIAVGQKLARTGRSSLVSRKATQKIADLLAQRSLEQRRTLPGLNARRAEIIIAGATVYAELMQRCNLPGFRFSPLGLRDGLIVQMASEHDHNSRSRRRIDSERSASLLAAAEHYRVDIAHAKQVRATAEQLFLDLRSLHHLPAEMGELLAAAAMLYEAGLFIGRNGRHRHAYYIISNSEILGYTPAQRRVIATIARFLGKSRTLPGDPIMLALAVEERAAVSKAVVLLRLARALNLGRGNSLAGIRARTRGQKAYINLKPKRGSGVELELWALEKEKDYFREVLGRELVVSAE